MHVSRLHCMHHIFGMICTVLVVCLQVLPEAPRELVEELSRRYVYLYERITGQEFKPPFPETAVGDRMLQNMQRYL